MMSLSQTRSYRSIKQELKTNIIESFMINDGLPLSISQLFQKYENLFKNIGIEAINDELFDFFNSIDCFVINGDEIHYLEKNPDQILLRRVQEVHEKLSDHDMTLKNQKTLLALEEMLESESDEDEFFPKARSAAPLFPKNDPVLFENFPQVMHLGDKIMELNAENDVEIDKEYNIKIWKLDDEQHDKFDFHFHFKYQLKAVEGMMSEMMKTYNDDKQLTIPKDTIQPGLYCAVFNYRFWYRAVILRILDANFVEVLLIDFGQMLPIPRSHMKFLLSIYSQLPAQALKGTMVADVEIKEIFEFDNLFRVKFINWDNDVAYLEYLSETEIKYKKFDVEPSTLRDNDDGW